MTTKKLRFRIGPVEVSETAMPVLVAEIGINHNGSLELARRLAQAVKHAGGRVAKFQTYITEKRTKRGSPIFDILKKCELSFKDQHDLFEYSRSVGVEPFSTPFDEESVAFLREEGVAAYKVASFDIVNRALVRAIAKSRKPVIVSTGMASLAETDWAVRVLRAEGVPFALLHCVSAYPLPPEQVNLRVMDLLRERYKCLVGYSDHTLTIDAARAAIARGAVMIEKHFTLDKRMDGPDHQLSCDPEDFRLLTLAAEQIHRFLGKPEKRVQPGERPILQYRRATR